MEVAQDMASASPYFTIFLLCQLLSLGAAVADTPLGTFHGTQENHMYFSSPESTTQLDTVPAINPTTPGTMPSVNPTESPPPPTAVTAPPVTTNPPATTTPTSSGGSWCIASPTAAETALQVALDYACGYSGTDCSAIQPGASCYEPNTVRDHASYAFNSYYQKNPVSTSCVFGGTAQLTTTDPSKGNCLYASPTTTPSISPPVNPTPMVTAPTTMTPTTTTPGGQTIFGMPGPTEQPSSATTVSYGLMLLLAATGTVWPLLSSNHL